jgi:fatty-acyl-CoA synthase
MRIASTMMDFPLTLGHVFRHGSQVHSRSSVSTWAPQDVRHTPYADVADRATRLAAVLSRAGVRFGDVVGTLCWNHQEHLETYLAVPAMGAVLHTINLRLAPEQLTHIIRHAGDRVLIVDCSLLGLLAPIATDLPNVRHVIVIGEVDRGTQLAGINILGAYDDLLRHEVSEFSWPEVDERAPAAMCYTSGTTGNAKAVVYSHRSQVLHALSINAASNFALTESDKILALVPFFHANAWGLPYAGWWTGADFLLPQQFLRPPHLAAMIATEKPTFSAAVPTVWNDLLNWMENCDLSSLRQVVSGGSAVPLALIERFYERFGILITQGWGMTECSPLAAITGPLKNRSLEGELVYRSKAGRLIPGVELRLVADDRVQPWDGQSIGEIQLRGPWITQQYFNDDAPSPCQEGWLRTGDIGTVDRDGFVTLVDRSKDVIKSGGEWISSVVLENELMGHKDILEAAVVAVADERWGERPLACVVLLPDAKLGAADLREWLSNKVPRWWLPERWAFIAQVPRTHVGKFDKKLLRADYAESRLLVETAMGEADLKNEPV